MGEVLLGKANRRELLAAVTKKTPKESVRLLLARDEEIQHPTILEQLRQQMDRSGLLENGPACESDSEITRIRTD